MAPVDDVNNCPSIALPRRNLNESIGPTQPTHVLYCLAAADNALRYLPLNNCIPTLPIAIPTTNFDNLLDSSRQAATALHHSRQFRLAAARELSSALYSHNDKRRRCSPNWPTSSLCEATRAFWDQTAASILWPASVVDFKATLLPGAKTGKRQRSASLSKGNKPEAKRRKNTVSWPSNEFPIPDDTVKTTSSSSNVKNLETHIDANYVAFGRINSSETPTCEYQDYPANSSIADYARKFLQQILTPILESSTLDPLPRRNQSSSGGLKKKERLYKPVYEHKSYRGFLAHCEPVFIPPWTEPIQLKSLAGTMNRQQSISRSSLQWDTPALSPGNLADKRKFLSSLCPDIGQDISNPTTEFIRWNQSNPKYFRLDSQNLTAPRSLVEVSRYERCPAFNSTEHVSYICDLTSQSVSFRACPEPLSMSSTLGIAIPHTIEDAVYYYSLVLSNYIESLSALRVLLRLYKVAPTITSTGVLELTSSMRQEIQNRVDETTSSKSPVTEEPTIVEDKIPITPGAIQEHAAHALVKSSNPTDWIHRLEDNPVNVHFKPADRVGMSCSASSMTPVAADPSKAEKQIKHEQRNINFDESESQVGSTKTIILSQDALVYLARRNARDIRRRRGGTSVTYLSSGHIIATPSLPRTRNASASYQQSSGNFVLEQALAPDSAGQSYSEIRPTNIGRQQSTTSVTSGSEKASNRFRSVLDRLPLWAVALRGAALGYDIWEIGLPIVVTMNQVGGILLRGSSNIPAHTVSNKIYSDQRGDILNRFIHDISGLQYPSLFSRMVRQLPIQESSENQLAPRCAAWNLGANVNPLEIPMLMSDQICIPTVVTIKSPSRVVRRIEISWDPTEEYYLWEAVGLQMSDSILSNVDEIVFSHTDSMVNSIVTQMRNLVGLYSNKITLTGQSTLIGQIVVDSIDWTMVASFINSILYPFDRAKSPENCAAKFISILLEYMTGTVINHRSALPSAMESQLAVDPSVPEWENRVLRDLLYCSEVKDCQPDNIHFIIVPQVFETFEDFSPSSSADGDVSDFLNSDHPFCFDSHTQQTLPVRIVNTKCVEVEPSTPVMISASRFVDAIASELKPPDLKQTRKVQECISNLEDTICYIRENQAESSTFYETVDQIVQSEMLREVLKSIDIEVSDVIDNFKNSDWEEANTLLDIKQVRLHRLEDHKTTRQNLSDVWTQKLVKCHHNLNSNGKFGSTVTSENEFLSAFEHQVTLLQYSKAYFHFLTQGLISLSTYMAINNPITPPEEIKPLVELGRCRIFNQARSILTPILHIGIYLTQLQRLVPGLATLHESTDKRRKMQSPSTYHENFASDRSVRNLVQSSPGILPVIRQLKIYLSEPSNVAKFKALPTGLLPGDTSHQTICQIILMNYHKIILPIHESQTVKPREPLDQDTLLNSAINVPNLFAARDSLVSPYSSKKLSMRHYTEDFWDPVLRLAVVTRFQNLPQELLQNKSKLAETFASSLFDGRYLILRKPAHLESLNFKKPPFPNLHLYPEAPKTSKSNISSQRTGSLSSGKDVRKATKPINVIDQGEIHPKYYHGPPDYTGAPIWNKMNRQPIEQPFKPQRAYYPQAVQPPNPYMPPGGAAHYGPPQAISGDRPQWMEQHPHYRPNLQYVPPAMTATPGFYSPPTYAPPGNIVGGGAWPSGGQSGGQPDRNAGTYSPQTQPAARYNMRQGAGDWPRYQPPDPSGAPGGSYTIPYGGYNDPNVYMPLRTANASGRHIPPHGSIYSGSAAERTQSTGSRAPFYGIYNGVGHRPPPPQDGQQAYFQNDLENPTPYMPSTWAPPSI